MEHLYPKKQSGMTPVQPHPARRAEGQHFLVARTFALCLTVLGIMPIFQGNAAGAVRQHKEHKRDYRREIQAAEEQWRAAQIAGDVAAMNKLLAEDYFGITMAGELNNKQQQLERLRSRSLVLTRIDVSDVKIKLVGGVGIVTSLAKIEGTSDGRSVKGTYRYTRIYKRGLDKSWQVTNFEVTKIPA